MPNVTLLSPLRGGRGLARIAAFLFALLFLVLAAPLRAEPEYPAFTGRVVDAANVLSPWDYAEINRKLKDLEDKTGVQFAVATVRSLGGDEIEPYANALFRKWKIGQKDVNNGLLLILAPNERKLRFEVGYGLEGTMTDAQSKLILRNDMVPKLKAGNPGGALKAGVDDAIEVLTKDKDSLPARLKVPKEMDAKTSLFITLFIIAFVVLMFVSVIRANRRRGASGRWTWGAPGGFVAGSSSSDSSSGGGFSDSGSSSSGGDSFSGGGGGDSGGGGSSDSY